MQGVLRPLHDLLMGKLRTIPQDCTYHQERVFSWYKEQVVKGKDTFYSLDLSAATDRLPLAVQARVLKCLFHNRALAKDWMELIAGLGFSTRIGRKTQVIRYAVGQAMGLYRSWPILAITNHVLIRYAAVKVGRNNYGGYLVLGDDVVIADGDVALRYRQVLADIGVRVSEHKSIFPSPKKGIEFASKLISVEGNLRPLPIMLLMQPGLAGKLQFLSLVVKRLVADDVQRAPDLEILINAVAGRRLSDALGDLWGKYFVFSCITKQTKYDLVEGRVPELFCSDHLRSKAAIAMVSDLQVLLDRTSLARILVAMSSLKELKTKTVKKIHSALRKMLVADSTLHVQRFLRSLGSEQPLGLRQDESAQLTYCVSQYFRGPLRLYFTDLSMFLEGLRPHIGPALYPDLAHGHEKYMASDAYLSKIDMELLDRVSRLGQGPLSLYRNPYWRRPGVRPPRRMDSTATRIRIRRTLMIATALGGVSPLLVRREKSRGRRGVRPKRDS